MSKAIRNCLRNQDGFGQPILLNFNNKGNTHNTLFGGIVSLLSNALLLAYFCIHVDKMLGHKDDKVTIQASAFDFYNEQVM